MLDFVLPLVNEVYNSAKLKVEGFQSGNYYTLISQDMVRAIQKLWDDMRPHTALGIAAFSGVLFSGAVWHGFKAYDMYEQSIRVLGDDTSDDDIDIVGVTDSPEISPVLMLMSLEILGGIAVCMLSNDVFFEWSNFQVAVISTGVGTVVRAMIA